MTDQPLSFEELREGYREHGALICDGCNTRVDLSEALDAREAADLWNDHIREEHPENYDD